MQDINVGIKISTKNFNLLPEIYLNDDIINFIEIRLDPEFTSKDIRVIKNFELPYVIHLPNSNNGIDFGDLTNNKENVELIERVNQYKKELIDLKPICFIIHPESGDIELSIENIQKLKIEPLALENMPVLGINGKKMLGYDANSLYMYFKSIEKLKFCFDINHAIKAAISMKRDYLLFIREFLEFKKPTIFHISGGNLNIETDEHLALDEGQYNLSEIKKILLNYKHKVSITFETPRNYDNKISDDLKNIEIFKKAVTSEG